MIDEDLCIVGLKVENSNEFYAIYQNKIFEYKKAQKIVRHLRNNNLPYCIYRIVGFTEIK